MTGVTADQVLGWLEQEPAAPFSATTLRHLQAHDPDHLWTPRWWRLPTPAGLPTLGLVAMQVASNGHAERLKQAWDAWGPTQAAVSLAGDLPVGGLLWLVGTRSVALNAWVSDTLRPHFESHGVSVDAVWQAAWRACGTMRTQNAVDLPWDKVVQAWAQDQDYQVPRPSPAAAADLALTVIRAQMRELTAERVWADHVIAEPTSPLIPWLVTHASEMGAAGTWVTQLLGRKRKSIPVLDEALCTLIQRGAAVTLPHRAETLVPQAMATARAQQALTETPTGTGRPRRMRS